MKFSKKKAAIKIPHPTIDLVKGGYVSEDGIWSIHKEDLLGVDRKGNWIINYYVLSHLPSGAKMPWEFSTLKAAKAFCAEISPVADWKQLRTIVADGKIKVLPESFRKVLGYQCTEIYNRQNPTRESVKENENG